MITIDPDHLNKVKMTYFEHAKFALGISKKLLMASAFFLVHGAIPTVQFDNYDLKSLLQYLRDIHEERS